MDEGRSVADPEEYWCLPADDLKEALAARNKQASFKKKQPPNIYASLQTYNKAVEPQSINMHNDSYAFEWTETEDRLHIFGKEAMRIDPNEPYELRWPIRRGVIDRTHYSSYRDALVDLELIWTAALRKDLAIEGPFSAFNAMVVVPASITRWEIRAYTECLLDYMGFAAISFILEPVASSFGAGISSGCIVDMGAQCISVACVEEGSVVPDSVIRLEYGGDDITRLLFQILRHHSFPYVPVCGLLDPLDFELLNDLREKFCTLDEEEIQSVVYEFFVRRPGATTLNYNFKVIEERLLAVQAMLEPGAPWLIPYEQERRQVHLTRIMSFWTGAYDLDLEHVKSGVVGGDRGGAQVVDVDAEDVEASQVLEALPDSNGQDGDGIQSARTFECKWNGCDATPFETIALATEHIKTDHLAQPLCQWAGCQSSKTARSEMSRFGHLLDHLNDEAMNASPAPMAQPLFTHTEPAPLPLVEQSLDEAIWSSCSSAPSHLPRALSSILLVGGLSQTPGLPTALWHLLSARLADSDLPIPADAPPLTIEFVATGRDLNPTFFSWKGGAVASKLEPTAETWISAEEYRNWGPKLFRERLPFNTF